MPAGAAPGDAARPAPLFAPKRTTPPPFPVVAGLAAATSDPPPSPSPVVPHVRAPAGLREEDLLPKPPGAASAFRQRAQFAAALVLAAVLAYVIYRQTRTPASSPPSAVASRPAASIAAAHPAIAATEKPKAGPTPSATLNRIAETPGHLVGQAQAVVKAQRENEPVRVNAPAAGEETPGRPPPATPSPSTLTRAPAATSVTTTSTLQVAPGITATLNENDEVAGSTNPVLREWAANARINGVFQGSPARALINGHTVRAGQVVDEDLGIVFDHIDAGTKTIVFRDRSGAKVARRY